MGAQTLLLFQLVISFIFYFLASMDLSCHNSIINPMIFGAGLGGFVACRALSQRNTDPSKASRPWDTVILIQILFFIFFIPVL